MSSDEMQAPSAPSLVAPRDATAVYGAEVTFVWEPIEDAETYRLQVAPTARFEECIVDVDVGDETAITVGHQLPLDGQTFFWRVRAETPEGEHTDSRVESFIATTESEADVHLPVPSAETEPVTGLARAEQRESEYAFELADQFQKEKERGVAYEGVAARQIMGIAVSIIVVVMVAIGILFGWFGQVGQAVQTEAVDRQRYEQIRQAELEAEQRLQSYGVVDEEEGIYRIPIDRAKNLIATEEYRQRQGESP